jgi:formamidopyrimidine-DNA glycosylase
MPEGPEVEVIRRELKPLVDQVVKKISLTPLSQKYPKYQGRQGEFDQFSKQKLKKITRFNKFLVWEFEKGPVILNHFGMSGRWIIVDSIEKEHEKITHPKVIVETNGPLHAVFDDTRNFGQFRVFSSMDDVKKYRPIRTIGIDGLEEPFPTDEFLEKLGEDRFANKQIGLLLMDPRLVAGIGNIYKAEILFASKIHPERLVSSLTKPERESLSKTIPGILQFALNDKGSSFDARYVLPSGEDGEAQRWHKVYQRRNKPCSMCETIIQIVKQDNRSTYYCPECQK